MTLHPFSNREPLSPCTEGWSIRRRIAEKLRLLNHQLLTKDSDDRELAELEAQLNRASQLLANDGDLLGRIAWSEAEQQKHGDYHGISREITPLAGQSNALAPPLHMWIDGDKAYAKLTLDWVYEGPPGCVHGGIVAALFDEFLGCAQVLSGNAGATGTLKVKYHRPTPLNTELNLEGRLFETKGRKIVMRGKMIANGEVTASCEGLFVIVPDGVKNLSNQN